MTYVNPYPPGQCTWGMGEIANWCLRFGNLTDAKNWATVWRERGGLVTAVPTVGAVACFQPGEDGAFPPYGHVGLVDAIHPGAFEIREMNGPAGAGHFDERWCADVAGVQFLLNEGAQPAPYVVTPTAFIGTVQVQAANFRQGPGTQFPVMGVAPRGLRINFDAYCYGEPIFDSVARQLDHRWFRIGGGDGRWVASALIDGNPPNSHP